MSLSLHGGGAAWVAFERPERRYHYLSSSSGGAAWVACERPERRYHYYLLSVVVVVPRGSLASDLSDAIIVITVSGSGGAAWVALERPERR